MTNGDGNDQSRFVHRMSISQSDSDSMNYHSRQERQEESSPRSGCLIVQNNNYSIQEPLDISAWLRNPPMSSSEPAFHDVEDDRWDIAGSKLSKHTLSPGRSIGETKNRRRQPKFNVVPPFASPQDIHDSLYGKTPHKETNSLLMFQDDLETESVMTSWSEKELIPRLKKVEEAKHNKKNNSKSKKTKENKSTAVFKISSESFSPLHERKRYHSRPSHLVENQTNKTVLHVTNPTTTDVDSYFTQSLSEQPSGVPIVASNAIVRRWQQRKERRKPQQQQQQHSGGCFVFPQRFLQSPMDEDDSIPSINPKMRSPKLSVEAQKPRQLPQEMLKRESSPFQASKSNVATTMTETPTSSHSMFNTHESTKKPSSVVESASSFHTQHPTCQDANTQLNIHVDDASSNEGHVKNQANTNNSFESTHSDLVSANVTSCLQDAKNVSPTSVISTKHLAIASSRKGNRDPPKSILRNAPSHPLGNGSYPLRRVWVINENHEQIKHQKYKSRTRFSDHVERRTYVKEEMDGQSNLVETKKKLIFFQDYEDQGAFPIQTKTLTSDLYNRLDMEKMVDELINDSPIRTLSKEPKKHRGKDAIVEETPTSKNEIEEDSQVQSTAVKSHLACDSITVPTMDVIPNSLSKVPLSDLPTRVQTNVVSNNSQQGILPPNIPRPPQRKTLSQDKKRNMESKLNDGGLVVERKHRSLSRNQITELSREFYENGYLAEFDGVDQDDDLFIEVVAAVVIQASIRKFLAIRKFERLVVDHFKRYLEISTEDNSETPKQLNQNLVKDKSQEKDHIIAIQAKRQEEYKGRSSATDEASKKNNPKRIMIASKDQKSRVYISEFQLERIKLYVNSAIAIQRVFRGWLVRDLLHIDNFCAIRIQTLVRGFLARCSFYFDIYCIILIQSFVRMSQARELVGKQIAFVVLLQSHIRGFLTRKQLQSQLQISKTEEAATKIQSIIRSFVAHERYLNKLADILVVQSVIRRWLVRKFPLWYHNESKFLSQLSGVSLRVRNLKNQKNAYSFLTNPSNEKNSSIRNQFVTSSNMGYYQSFDFNLTPNTHHRLMTCNTAHKSDLCMRPTQSLLQPDDTTLIGTFVEVEKRPVFDEALSPLTYTSDVMTLQDESLSNHNKFDGSVRSLSEISIPVRPVSIKTVSLGFEVSSLPILQYRPGTPTSIANTDTATKSYQIALDAAKRTLHNFSCTDTTM
jgi:IQ calmodulin-binding motif